MLSTFSRFNLSLQKFPFVHVVTQLNSSFEPKKWTSKCCFLDQFVEYLLGKLFKIFPFVPIVTQLKISFESKKF